jgi:hypothetical protein
MNSEPDRSSTLITPLKIPIAMKAPRHADKAVASGDAPGVLCS